MAPEPPCQSLGNLWYNMLMNIEAGKAERPLPNHGDDRLVLMPELGRFALFDGIGPFSGDIAANTFKAQHSGDSDLPLLSDVFATIQSEILKFCHELPEKHKVLRNYIRTTGTAFGVRVYGNSTTPWLEFAHVGDSSLHMFDHESARLSRVTHDEWPDRFLGSGKYQLRQYGGFVLSPHVTLAAFSDGIGSEEGNMWQSQTENGITEAVLKDILAGGASCEDKARRILEASKINDDKSVIVIEARQ